MSVPQDMIVEESKDGWTVVSIRDLMVLLGASDEQLRDVDERGDILAREPWRKNGLREVDVVEYPNGWKTCRIEGEIDWSGTRFEGKMAKEFKKNTGESK